MLIDPNKPLRARTAVFKLYEAEWKALYERRTSFNDTFKDPVSQTLGRTPTSNGRREEIDDVATLSDETILALEAIVERKLSAVVDRLAFALRAAADVFEPSHIPSATAKETTAPEREAGFVHISSNGDISEWTAMLCQFDDIKDDDDLTKLGLDSLQVASLLSTINAFIVKSGQPMGLIRKEVIFAHPTIAKPMTAISRQ
ncbi:putative secondary metabolism biosynthetic enzyme [Pestalotiopsis sp. IQ-011]